MAGAMLSAPIVKEQGLHHPTTGDGALSGASPAKTFPQVNGGWSVVGSLPLSTKYAKFQITTFSALYAV